MGNRRLGRKRLESVLKQLDGTSADSTGSRAGKSGFQMPPWQLMPAKYFGWMDDFLVANGSVGVAQDEDLAQASAIDNLVWRTNIDGTSDTITLDNSQTGGVVNILHGTGDNEETHMTAINHGFALDASNARELWMTCRLKTSDANATGIYIGLASDNGTEETSVSGGGLQDGVGFYLADGAASEVITLLTAVGDSETVTSLTDSFVDATYVTLSLYFDGSSVQAYVNGVLRATVNSTLPTDGTIMFPAIHVAAREGAANTVSIDYMSVCMER